MRRFNILMFATIAIFIAGCADNKKPTVEIKGLGARVGDRYNYETIVIDGCQYVVVAAGNCSLMSHKGDCNNPIHVYKMEKGQ